MALASTAPVAPATALPHGGRGAALGDEEDMCLSRRLARTPIENGIATLTATRLVEVLAVTSASGAAAFWTGNPRYRVLAG